MPSLLLSFDNLGEASKLERGTWDGSVPLGRDPSVTLALPRLLRELDRLGLRATFFVEGINCDINPDSVRAIAAGGHEIGCHGWRHEPWHTLSADDERALLSDATDAFTRLGVRPVGFRPPGGQLNESTPALLRELGYTWCSPHAEAAVQAEEHGLQVRPFEWTMVDAYYLMDRFAELREAAGESHEPMDPGYASLRIENGLTSNRPRQTVILHPFLMLEERWWTQVRRLLLLLAESSRCGGLTVGPGRELT